MAHLNYLRQVADTATNTLASIPSTSLPSSLTSASMISSAIVSATNIASPTVNEGASGTGTGVASATPTETGDSGGGTTQSPLLFFVALGFGVVFTNLWIIVGVKYCFRYNARNRAMAAQHADHINLADVQPRPHRRRRERKLLSMEEVERQFPLCKYGDWVERRKNEGAAVPSGGVDAETAKSLHNAEGVIAPVSPPVSPGLKEVEGKREAGKTDETTTTVDEVVAPPAAPAAPAPAVVASPIPNESRNHSHTILPAPYPGTPSNEKPSDPSILATLAQVDTRQTHDPKSPHPHDTDSEPDSDHEALHPVDTSDHPGDTCAICIDTLLASDDIRGLTCNHAFHASCIDPWLTSRRACCPLCKRDFWVPKVRTPAEEAAEEERRNNRRLRREALRAERLAGGPGVGGVWAVRGTRVYIPGRLMGGGVMFREESQYQNSRHARTARERQRAWDEHVANRQRERDLRRAERERADGAGSTRTLAQRFNGLFGRSANAPAAPTPSQVEAGTAPQVTAPAPAAVPGNALQSRF